MPKTLEQVKADVLSLPDTEIDTLLDQVISQKSDQAIESTLQERLEGPFVQIQDPKAHYSEFLDELKNGTA